jgi:PmbA protein
MLAEAAVKKAIKQGATEAEAYQVEETSIQVQFNSEDKNIKTTISKGLGVRVSFGKRIGLYSTTIIDESETDEVINRACKIAKASPEDPDWVSFNQKFGSSEVKGLDDSRIYSLGPSDLVERIDSAIELIDDYDDSVKASSGILATSYDKVTLSNSSQEEFTKNSTGIYGYILASRNL